MRSFRLRIAVLSSLATAFALLLMALMVHGHVARRGLAQIDAGMTAEMRQVLTASRRVPNLRQFEERLGVGYPRETGATFILAAQGPRRHESYASEFWPVALDPRDLDPEFPAGDDWHEAARERSDDLDAREPPPRFPRAERRPPPRPRPTETSLGLSPSEEEELFFLADDSAAAPAGGRPLAARRSFSVVGFRDAVIDGEAWRFGIFSDGLGRFIMGQRRESLDVQLAALRGAFVLAFPAVLVFVFAATILVARRSTRAIDRLAETVESITAKGLDQRLATADTDMEFRRLVDGFNAMLERLEVSFKNSQRFTGNAAHELKTPLTILRGQLEGAIGREDAGSERQRALAEMLEETARLKTIIDRLLLLARADAGRLDLFPIEFNLSTTIEGLIEDAAAMTEGLDFQADFKPKVLITADRALVSQVLHNLISNAVKYNRGSGYVRVKMRERGEGIHIMVANSGEAIDAERREQIFERFYRGDAAHNRDVDGVGLGLNLAREIARAHGGDLVLAASGEPGNAFILSLPKRAKNRQKSAE